MQWLKWIAGVALVLALVLVGGGWLISPQFSVLRSTSVNAPPDKVYALIADPREWKRWTVWNRRDPGMQMEYSGADNGVGAGWSWKSESEGNGRMKFTAAEPGQRLAYELFFPDFGTTSYGELHLTARGATTAVSWTMDGDMGSNPLNRWFALFAESLIGPDFEGGLANLKALAEGS